MNEESTWSHEARISMAIICSSDSLIFNQHSLEEVLDRHMLG